MALAMAAVGDLVSPRERGRYQGYIAAAFAVATVVGPLLGGAARRGRRLALGLLREPADRAARPGRPALPAARGRRPAARTPGSTSSAPSCWPARRRRSCSPASGAASATPGARWRTLGLLASPRSAARRSSPRARGRRPDRAAGLLRTRGRGDRQRRPVPGHRGAVRDHGLRPAVPADDHRRDADRGGPAAGAGDARHHALDRARRAQRRPHRALQALPGRRDGADGRGPGAAGRRRRRPVAARRPRSASPSSASASAWSARS